MYTWYFQTIVKTRKYKKSLKYILAHKENNVVEHEKLINFGSLGKSAFLSLPMEEKKIDSSDLVSRKLP